MGECNYYLKARFQTAEHAKDAAARLCDLLGQGEAARAYWQNSRPVSASSGASKPPSAEQFWAEFEERFPLVYAYLGKLAGIAHWDNGLAGQLSCFVDPRVARRHDPSASLTIENDVLSLKLSGIWHCAEFDLFERYCRGALGAVAFGGVSDENFDLDEEDEETMEDWEYFEAVELE